VCVKVYVGNAEHVYGCIRYETQQLSVAWIIAIIVVLGVPIIVVFIVCIIDKCKPAKSKKVPPDSQVPPLPLTPPYYTYVRRHQF